MSHMAEERCGPPALPEGLTPIGLIVPGQLLTEGPGTSLRPEPRRTRGLTKVRRRNLRAPV